MSALSRKDRQTDRQTQTDRQINLHVYIRETERVRDRKIGGKEREREIDRGEGKREREVTTVNNFLSKIHPFLICFTCFISGFRQE